MGKMVTIGGKAWKEVKIDNKEEKCVIKRLNG